VDEVWDLDGGLLDQRAFAKDAGGPEGSGAASHRSQPRRTSR
jgi:hypothetical protein